VEVFVEEHEVAPVAILLELFGTSVHPPPAVRVAQEDVVHAPRDLVAHIPQAQLPARPLRAFDGELVTVVGIQLA
jgi:hypothetical protein